MKKSKLVFIAIVLICFVAIIISIYSVARTKTAYQDVPDRLKYQSSAGLVTSGDASVAEEINGTSAIDKSNKPKNRFPRTK